MGTETEGKSMVVKTIKCSFSGLNIYPGHGVKFVRKDSTVYTFINAKVKRLFWNTRGQLKAARIAWTMEYRKQHKKNLDEATGRKKRGKTAAKKVRAINGASVEEIEKLKNMNSAAREAQRAEALQAIKAAKQERSKGGKKAKK